MKKFCVLLLVGMLIGAECNSIHGIVQQNAAEQDAEEKGVAAVVGLAITAASTIYNLIKDNIHLLWELPAKVNKPYWHMINFQLDENDRWQSGRLQDGDVIRITRKAKRAGTSTKQVSIVLVQPTNTWWKGVVSYTYENSLKAEIVTVQDSSRISQETVEYREFLENYVVLAKAKAFGAHTPVYWIQNSYDMGPNYEWEITWLYD